LLSWRISKRACFPPNLPKLKTPNHKEHQKEQSILVQHNVSEQQQQQQQQDIIPTREQTP